MYMYMLYWLPGKLKVLGQVEIMASLPPGQVVSEILCQPLHFFFFFFINNNILSCMIVVNILGLKV